MKMSTTGLFITIGIIIAGIYDLCMVLFTGAGSSISDYLIRAGFKSPVIVFAFGFVCGHLFGYMKLDPAKADKKELEQICKDSGHEV